MDQGHQSQKGEITKDLIKGQISNTRQKATLALSTEAWEVPNV